MAADYLHGVEHFYLENGNKPIEVLAASVIGLVATADDVDPLVFPLNVPTLVNSDKFIAKAGTTGTLRGALSDIYRQSGALVVVVRVPEEDVQADQVGEIIGGIDNETSIKTGLNALLSAESLLGLVPRLIIVPEFSHLDGVGPAMELVAKKLNGIAIIDGSGSGFSAVINEVKAFDEVYFVNCGVTVFDDLAGTYVDRFASATVAGHIVRVDSDEGYWNSPSNRKMYGIKKTVQLIDYVAKDANSLANLYNAQNVSVIINKKGGFYLWGNKLANGDLLPHQRVRYIVGDSIVEAHQYAVDRNITKQYVESVKNRVNGLIRRLVNRQVISGGECWVDKELNISSIGTNQVFWDYDLGLYDVAERMTFRQHINNTYNEKVFN